MADGDNNVLRFSELSLYDKKIKNYADEKVNKLAEEIAGMDTYNEIYSEDSLNLGRVSESTKGEYSSTLGRDNVASGTYSHAGGYHTYSISYAAHAEGDSTTAGGYYSHTEGRETRTTGSQAHAEGGYTSALGNGAHAEGGSTLAGASGSHAEGGNTKAIGWYSHAEGQDTTAYGDYNGAHAEGGYTYAQGIYSHAEGSGSTAYGSQSHAEGLNTYAAEYCSHTEGYRSSAYGSYAHAEGYQTCANNSYSHAEGDSTTAGYSSSHAEGHRTYAGGSSSHAEGDYTTTMASYSHVEGSGCYISELGYDAHAEGGYTTVANAYAHSEGYYTYAGGASSHVEGYYTCAKGEGSHAEGNATYALEYGSHAEGNGTTASGKKSHAEGENTLAVGKCQHVEGSYNIANPKYLHILGNGNKPIYEYDKNNNYTISNEELNNVYEIHIFKDGIEINWLDISKSNYPVETEWGWDIEDANIITYNTPVIKVITEQDPFIAEDTEQIYYVNNHASNTDYYYENDYIYENGDKYIEVSTTYDDNKTVIYRYGLWLLDGDVEYTENSNAHTIDWDGNAWFAGEITDGHGNTLSEVAAAISGGGGGSYTLPTASTSTLGGVKIDNFTTKINNNGVLSTGSEVITVLTMPEPSADYLNKIVHCIGDYGFQNGNYYMCVENTDSNAAQQPYKWIWRGDLHVAPTASDTNIGMVRPDGTTILIDNSGTISVDTSKNQVRYSTSERIVGSWIDGNPVYQITLTGDAAPANGTVLLSNVETLISAFGSQLYTYDGTQRWYDFPYTGDSNGPRLELIESSHELQILCNPSYFSKYRWTIQYTKVQGE